MKTLENFGWILFPHYTVFWEPKVQKGSLLAGMTISQILSQTVTLEHMIVRQVSYDQVGPNWESDSEFSPLQNSYLMLALLGLDLLPVGALRPFEPWEVVETGLISLLYGLPDSTLNHAEQ